MATDTVTIEQFVNANRISIKADRVDRNPHMKDSDRMDNWKVTLKRKIGKPAPGSGRAMTLYFSMGIGHNGAAPEAKEVLSCLASDAAGVANAQSFEDWCSEYGYDTDSRTAEKTYKTVEHQAARLKTFLGDDLYNQLLWHTEAL